MLSTLADKVRPEHCALLIVDVQNDFCAEGGAMHREGRDITLVKAMVPRLAHLIEAARAARVRCAWNGDFYEIKPLPEEAIVTKHRYGAFESSDLDLVLRSQGIRTVIMTGVATNVCVETTARQAFLRDYYVVFAHDCTATYSQADHDATLRNIDMFFGEVVDAEALQACWRPGSARLRAVAP